MGCASGLLLSCSSPSHVGAGGIPAGMVGRRGYLGKDSLGIPIPRNSQTTRTSGAVCHGWDERSLGYTKSGHGGTRQSSLPPQPISAKARQRRNLWARLCQNARQPPPPTKAIESTLKRRSNERQIARQVSRQQQYQAQTAAAPQHEGKGTTWPSQFRESHISLVRHE